MAGIYTYVEYVCHSAFYLFERLFHMSFTNTWRMKKIKKKKSLIKSTTTLQTGSAQQGSVCRLVLSFYQRR